MGKNLDFTLSQIIRHAFMSGAGYGDFDKISELDHKRWLEYVSPESQYREIVNALRVAAKNP